MKPARELPPALLVCGLHPLDRAPSEAGEIKNLSANHQSLLGRPSGGLAEFSAHGRSPGLRRIAGAAFPGLKVQWRKGVGTPLTVAGAATDRRRAYRVPYSPSGKTEGPCGTYVPASRGVVK